MPPSLRLNHCSHEGCSTAAKGERGVCCQLCWAELVSSHRRVAGTQGHLPLGLQHLHHPVGFGHVTLEKHLSFKK